jgi:hypothetical protein
MTRWAAIAAAINTIALVRRSAAGSASNLATRSRTIAMTREPSMFSTTTRMQASAARPIRLAAIAAAAP